MRATDGSQARPILNPCIELHGAHGRACVPAGGGGAHVILQRDGGGRRQAAAPQAVGRLPAAERGAARRRGACVRAADVCMQRYWGDRSGCEGICACSGGWEGWGRGRRMCASACRGSAAAWRPMHMPSTTRQWMMDDAIMIPPRALHGQQALVLHWLQAGRACLLPSASSDRETPCKWPMTPPPSPACFLPGPTPVWRQ